MKIYAVTYFDTVSYCLAYYGFYSTLQKAKRGKVRGKADEYCSSFAEDWQIKEIMLDK